MIGLETQKRVDMIRAKLDQMEEIYTDLRLEYLDMAKRYDETIERVEDLEADKVFLEELLSGSEVL